MGCLEDCIKMLKEIAVIHEATYYLKLIAFWIVFFALLHWVIESASKRWNKTHNEKTRDVQIEHRSYIVSIIHGLIVVPMAFFAMFYAW